MKLYQLTIPVLLLSSVGVMAQKSTKPFAANSISFESFNQGNVISKRADALYDNGSKIPFTSCWIRPMDNHINSDFPDYTPVVNAKGDKMFFTSRRKENVGNNKWFDGTYEAEDIYFSVKGHDGQWSKATKVVGKVNTSKNEAITWISPDASKMILCKNEDLFESELVNGAWTKPVAIKAINSDYRETHASYSPDGNTLFFTTNNPDEATVGGLDICMVKRDPSGEWGQPELVENVNSPLNEEDPGLLADGTFYFSSQGFSSMGGYDIFKTSIQEDGSFATPENIGFPINTAGNEPFISIIDGGAKAIFSSDRKGKENGEQNIYEITFLDKLHIPLVVELYDAKTKQLINGDVKMFESANPESNVALDNMSKGIFGLDRIGMDKDYSIFASAKNYSNEQLDFTTRNISEFDPVSFKMVEKVYLNPIDEIVKLKGTIVHFDFGKFILGTDAVAKLNSIKEVLLAHPTAKIVINAHTDDKGSNAFNDKLSIMRGKEVAQWLMMNGVDISRITVAAFGEIKPVADNATDENRGKNRRAEIEIIY